MIHRWAGSHYGPNVAVLGWFCDYLVGLFIIVTI